MPTISTSGLYTHVRAFAAEDGGLDAWLRVFHGAFVKMGALGTPLAAAPCGSSGADPTAAPTVALTPAPSTASPITAPPNDSQSNPWPWPWSWPWGHRTCPRHARAMPVPPKPTNGL
eukprot:gene1118-biopygen15273